MYSVRKASKNDIPLIQELCLQVWPQTYKDIISQEQIEFMLEKMYGTENLLNQLQSGFLFFILFDELTPIGYAGMERTDDDCFKLHRLYVIIENHRKGAGSYFLSQIEQFVTEQSGSTIELQVNRANSAVEFYKKRGFYIVKEADFDIGNGFYMNDFIMRKDITFAAIN